MYAFKLLLLAQSIRESENGNRLFHSPKQRSTKFCVRICDSLLFNLYFNHAHVCSVFFFFVRSIILNFFDFLNAESLPLYPYIV